MYLVMRSYGMSQISSVVVAVNIVYLCACVLHFLATLSVFRPLQPSPPHHLPPPLLPQDRGLPVPGQVSREVSVGCVSVHIVAMVVHQLSKLAE